MKEQKQKEDDKKVLTDHFITTLSPLLNKVGHSSAIDWNSIERFLLVHC